MTALLRAVHTRCDPAPLFVDRFGDRLITAAERRMLLGRFLAMLGDVERARIAAEPDADRALDLAALANPAYGGVVARSRWCEDRLREAVERGVRQYVIVGAGLDSFALRRPAWAADVAVFEIDTADTLASKRERVAAAGLTYDDRVHLGPVDLETEGVAPALARTPYRRERPSFVACLGVLPYLTGAGVQALLETVAASMGTGSDVVFDYLDPEAVAGGAGEELNRVRAALADRSGEPWRSGLLPTTLREQLGTLRLSLINHLDGRQLSAEYGSALLIPARMHLARARREEAHGHAR